MRRGVVHRGGRTARQWSGSPAGSRSRRRPLDGFDPWQIRPRSPLRGAIALPRSPGRSRTDCALPEKSAPLTACARNRAPAVGAAKAVLSLVAPGLAGKPASVARSLGRSVARSLGRSVARRARPVDPAGRRRAVCKAGGHTPRRERAHPCGDRLPAGAVAGPTLPPGRAGDAGSPSEPNSWIPCDMRVSQGETSPLVLARRPLSHRRRGGAAGSGQSRGLRK